jgi:O-antigen/teichoic acid export membrane protein
MGFAVSTVLPGEVDCRYGVGVSGLPGLSDADEPVASAPAKAGTGLLNRGVWTLAGSGISLGVRFGSNIVLARLLAPQIFGVMVIVNGLRMGIELLTDVGVEQNIVHNEKGLEDEFFNTAWTVQMIRGALLTLLFVVVSSPLAHFYAIDVRIFLAVSLIPFVNSLHSTSVFALVKRLDVKRRNLFECSAELLGFVTCVVLALVSPTVWALVGGALLATAMRSILSYCLPHPPHRFVLNKNCVREIVRFGKWIFLSSFVVYCASNIDRLTLGKLVPMALLGVYGMARTMAEIPAMLASRLGYQIVFPFLAAQSGLKGRRAHDDLGAARLRISLGGALLISFAIAWADRAVNIIYDPRYREAGWILSMLLFGTWLAILSNLNESVLLGCGRPSYSAYANGLRLAAVGISLPLCYKAYGLQGAVVAMIVAELIRYSAIAFGQHRMRWSFYRQDALCTVVLLLAVGFWMVIRKSAGMGTPWDLAIHGLFAKGAPR